MQTPALPLADLATSTQPAHEYAALRGRGVHRRDGDWVVARAADVAAALASPQLRVAPPRTAAGEAARLQAHMARFSDGTDRARRRALVAALLPDHEGIERAAAQRVRAAIGTTPGTFDVMPLARTVPVAVLAAALGIAPAEVGSVVAVTGRLCDGLAPTLAAPPARADVDLAAGELSALLEPLGSGDYERVAAGAGVLFQARDATAALIGAAVLGADGRPGARRQVQRALRHDPPVHCTRRVALDDVQLGGVVVPRGASVWIVLAAAEDGPPRAPATFGAGAHGCPGSSLAVALASGVVAALRAGGWRAVPGQPVSYEPRPNLRLPARVLMARP
jgi:cytochrome P450